MTFICSQTKQTKQRKWTSHTGAVGFSPDCKKKRFEAPADVVQHSTNAGWLIDWLTAGLLNYFDAPAVKYII